MEKIFSFSKRLLCKGYTMKYILGNNAITAREKNIALIIKLLNKYGVCSRANLAAHTGLTQASITYITKELIEWEVIYEVGVIEGASRHPSIGLSINPTRYALLGIQLNRDYIHVGLFTLSGDIIQKETIIYDKPEKPVIMIDNMLQCIQEILTQLPDEIILLGGGIALPGPFLPTQGKIELMSGAPDWSEIDIRSRISQICDVPLVLEHDANCGALAELWSGNVANDKDILYVNVADGIGAGLICNGKLYRGQLGTAGEIGHMCVNFNGPRCECGNKGCLELYCSLKKLKRDYDEILFEQDGESQEAVTAADILRLASQNNPIACRALDKSTAYLGLGLANLVNILNPGTIILADQFSKAGNILVDLTYKHMKKFLLKTLADHVEIRLTSAPFETIIMRGATIAVLEQLLKDPLQTFGRK